MMEPSHGQEVEMKAHLNVVGVIDVVVGVVFMLLGVLVAAAVVLFSPFISDSAFWQQEEGVVAFALWLLVSGLFIVIGIPSLIAGIGLLKQKRWARTLGMIVAVLALASFPVGTAAGIYTLWVLTQKETEQLLGAPA
jgi:hypothetical protein